MNRIRAFVLTAGAGFLIGPAASVRAQAAAANAAPAAPPAADWNFEEGSGTSAADATGHGNAATLKGGAAWEAGRIGAHALSLSGLAGCYADVPRPVLDTARSYTVTAWVKVKALTGFQTFVSEEGDAVSSFYLQLRADTGGFAFTVMPSDMVQDASLAKATGPAKPGVWYFLAGVHDAQAHTVTLYVDGAAQQTVPLAEAWHASGHTLIGRALFNGDPVDFVNGQVDDVCLYQSALSAGDILALDKAAPPLAAAAQTSAPAPAKTP